ncbi:MAG: acetamidase/formamidase family protein [Anaerolineales bacterium]|nr:acetamidase/formamidase family protein [Anaerolineales bacterium]
MPLHVRRDKLFYAFHRHLEPVARLQPGDEVVFETHDCFQGQIRTDADLVTSLDWNRTNPATGPVYIEGAKPGAILRIDVLDIKVHDRSVMVAIPGEGALGKQIKDMETTILRREGEAVVFKERVRLPLAPMIGVIGIAPAEGSVGNGVPGDHGGNMDCTLINKGSRLYLTVQVEGGLLGVGDLHACMGDGEIVVVGGEVAGEVRLRLSLVELPGLLTPFLENDELVATIASHPDLNVAVEAAIHNMSAFLTDFAGLSINDAGMLMSAAGSLKICQVVDPARTARFEFPKAVLNQLGYALPG